MDDERPASESRNREKPQNVVSCGHQTTTYCGAQQEIQHMEILGKYGSFLSGMIGAAVVMIGGLVGMKSQQVRLTSLIKSEQDRIRLIEKQRQEDRKDLYEHVQAINQHLHNDVKQLKSDMNARADRTDNAIARQLDMLHVSIAEIRNMMNNQIMTRRRGDADNG